MVSTSKVWILYIIRSPNSSGLYTGISTDPTNRLKNHNSGSKGAKYTRGKGPWEIVYLEVVGSQGDALRRERQVKSLGRQVKLTMAAEYLSRQGKDPAL